MKAQRKPCQRSSLKEGNESMLVAVIGIGSNSVRMLTACVQGDQFERLGRDRAGTRLFGGLDEKGNLSAKSMQDTVDAVRQMHQRALNSGVEKVHIFATSAVRDAGNQKDFCRMILESTGIEMEICSGEKEAALSFLGATEGERSGVIDIGGGSTEYVIGQGMKIDEAVSLQMGAVRLHRQMPIANESDVMRVTALAAGIFENGAQPIVKLPRPREWVGVGGTFTTLASLVHELPWSDRSRTHGTVITYEAALRFARRLSEMTVEERLALMGLQPHRADIVVHGICILLASMEKLGIGKIKVSTYGNVDGYIKARYGCESAKCS